ncbi:Restriction endonuclease [Algoriphagus hitonicola]|uniref:Restriction endonuclease n=1 Tax=Algoriphagus hitonicola TaxID=435880 RepID=A0A1I2VAV3_9BACT|nr:Restriction endonuclease [Algoriphagus hitonicola]
MIFQCKRYEGSVSRAQVGDFRNAMLGRAEKGIILTTGTFSRDAEKEASRDGAPPIELVDGKKLIQMFEMVKLGLKPKTVYDVDLNYFQKFKE